MAIDTVQTRLRHAITEVRRKSYPLSDLIPLMQEAADTIDRLSKDYDTRCYAEDFSGEVRYEDAIANATRNK